MKNTPKELKEQNENIPNYENGDYIADTWVNNYIPNLHPNIYTSFRPNNLFANHSKSFEGAIAEICKISGL